jgi:hypothetical protein
LGNLPDQFLLARDLALALSDVTVGLHQMPALLVCHRSPRHTCADDLSARRPASVIGIMAYARRQLLANVTVLDRRVSLFPTNQRPLLFGTCGSDKVRVALLIGLDSP